MTKEITGGFAVPGRAAPKAVGAPVYADSAGHDRSRGPRRPPRSCPASTRLKILETVSGKGDDAVFRVEGLDDPSIAGYVIARDLDPRDSWAPARREQPGRWRPDLLGRRDRDAQAVRHLQRVSGLDGHDQAWLDRRRHEAGDRVDRSR